MKLFVIGVGLIGGSFCKDIKQTMPDTIIYGIDSNEKHLDSALKIGFIDRPSTIEELGLADVVIISIPVTTTVTLLPQVLDRIQDTALVMDVGSTKQEICQSIATHDKRRNFLAIHPIAGTEFSGPEAAVDTLFFGKTNIICEVEKTAFKLQERAMKIFTALGMRIRYMDPVSHDKHIAYVSHLSHISSFMLGKTVIQKEKNEKDIFDMAGSGFASTVRLAKSSPAMWGPIFQQNKENVIESLSEYINNLSHFKSLLQNDDFEGLHKEMEDINHIKLILNGIEA
ncbi:prephenate dehydrogenase [Aquimarina intermedia]|uniref:Prephenate dehydrogenase n=1 Tax=Aquimarina intermedia TaxID=350814 RepID=A0A5S5CBJ9_9FLAO|nr:prephenate dehydrogenase [Aquimarina intermedia]TYP75882.1 prephenate dehydrogenase [Aquimarina intermedia]